MPYRYLNALAAIAVLFAVQPTPAETPGKKAIPRMADGRPDLRGSWTNSTYTPLERPVELGTKEFFTGDEAVAYEKQRRQKELSQAATDIHYDDALWQTEKYSKTLANARTSMVFDPPDGRLPPLSAKGQKRVPDVQLAARKREASEQAQDRTLAERCITWGNEGPPMIGSTYNANLQIVQNREKLVIMHEIIHGARIVPLNGEPRMPAQIQQLGGDSRGRWEGDTLIVESANFSDKTNFRGPPSMTRQDIFSSSEMKVTERFRMLDANTIEYRFTVDDPGTWTRPWSGELNLRRTEEPIYEYACHEGNYGLANILAGAREAERKAAASKSKP